MADEQKPKVRKCYRVELSTKTSIQIDDDEVAKVMHCIGNGKMAKVRQGIINPSYIVTITADTPRMQQLQEKLNDIDKHNEHDRLYGESKDQRRWPEMRSLADIFKDLPSLPGRVDAPGQLPTPRT